MQTRSADAHVDVLRLAEREALWVHALVCNGVARPVESEYDLIPKLTVEKPELVDHDGIRPPGRLRVVHSDEKICRVARDRSARTRRAREHLRNRTESGDPDATLKLNELSSLHEKHRREIAARPPEPTQSWTNAGTASPTEAQPHVLPEGRLW